MKQIEYIDQVKKKCAISSDRKLALKIKLHHTTISQIRQGVRNISQKAMLNIAILLEISPEKAFLDLMIDKTKDEKERKVWENIRGKY